MVSPEEVAGQAQGERRAAQVERLSASALDRSTRASVPTLTSTKPTTRPIIKRRAGKRFNANGMTAASR
jgi:hypothetical protein